MIGKLLIDNSDIQAIYGVILAEGSYVGLLSYPPLKQPEYNDWAEMDGLDVDLSNPVLDSKEFELKFASVSGANIEGLIELINSSVYHVFDFATLGIAKKLRIVEISDITGYSIKSFSIKVSDDFPISDRNILENPIVNEESNLYGFGIRQFEITDNSKDYIVTINGSSENAQNGHYLAVFLYNDNWSFSYRFELKARNNSTMKHKFTFPEIGTYYLTAYYYENTQPRDGSVRVNWYSVEEYGLSSFNRRTYYPATADVDQGLLLDGKNISSEYGIIALEGTENAITKPRSPKPVQKRSSNYIQGTEADANAPVKYQSKTATLKLMIQGFSTKKTIQNFNSFLYDLTRAGEHNLFWFQTNKNYKLFYKESNVSKIIFSNKISIIFDVTIEIIRED